MGGEQEDERDHEGGGDDSKGRDVPDVHAEEDG